MEVREIREAEVDGLYDCLAELSDYHNDVSVNFKGIYPTYDFKEALERFKRELAAGTSRIAVVGSGQILGFSKIDISRDRGKLEYLIVREGYRGMGYGGALMDWAMGCFRDDGVSSVEVKVIDGNPAVHLYEKYGFRTEAHILRCVL